MICDFLVGILCKSKAIRAKYSEIISIISNILIHSIFDSLVSILVFFVKQTCALSHAQWISRPKTESGRLERQGNGGNGWTFGEFTPGLHGDVQWDVENLAVNFLTPSFFLVGMLTHLVQEVVEVVAAHIFYLCLYWYCICMWFGVEVACFHAALTQGGYHHWCHPGHWQGGFGVGGFLWFAVRMWPDRQACAVALAKQAIVRRGRELWSSPQPWALQNPWFCIQDSKKGKYYV